MKSFNLVFGLCFAGAGFLILIGGISIGFIKYRDLENRVRVEGVVIESYAQSVIGYPNPQTGERLTAKTTVSSSPPAYEVGEKVMVFVNPENPSDAVIDGLMEQWFLPLFMTLFSSIFIGVGLVALISFGRAKSKESLKHTGIRVTGKITDVVRITNLTINDVNPWRIFVVVRNPVNGSEITVKSDLILDKPMAKSEDNITVYFDPQNPKKYLVDEAS